MGICLEFAGSDGIRSQHKKWREALLCCHYGKIHGEVRGENVMKAEIGGLAMVIGVFVSIRNWLGVSGIMAAVC